METSGGRARERQNFRSLGNVTQRMFSMQAAPESQWVYRYPSAPSCIVVPELACTSSLCLSRAGLPDSRPIPVWTDGRESSADQLKEKERSP